MYTEKTFRLEARRFFVKKIILVTVLVVCMIISAVAVSACNDGAAIRRHLQVIP